MISKKHDKFITEIKSDWSDTKFSVYYNDMLKCYKIIDKENKTCGYDFGELNEILSFINSRVLDFK